jgi:ribosomal protein S12 methylthiotransferase
LHRRIGQRMTVLVEAASEQGFEARSYADAPEIDGLVHIDTAESLALGQFCEVEVTGADEYDLYASPIR